MVDAAWAHRRITLVLAAGLGIVVASGCKAEHTSSEEAPSTIAAPSTSVPDAPTPPATHSADARSASPCAPPSLRHQGPLDGYTEADVRRCSALPRISKRMAQRCGAGASETELQLAQLAKTVLPMSRGTVDHVRSIAARGRRLGRRRRVIGFLGDSMTVSGAFMRDFSASRSGRFRLAPAVVEALRIDSASGPNATIIDLYRGARAEKVQGLWRDSLSARRAAKVGARASWALEGGRHSPLSTLIARLSPAIVVVLYGGNDAAYRPAPPEDLERDFEASMHAIIDTLEQAGVVPIINTLARHDHAPGVPDCSPGLGQSNWRLAVTTTALSRTVAHLACQRRLPLIDLRAGLDSAPHHGLSHDGTHPSMHARGSAQLTAAGLQCGYNIRNYLTWLMLKRLESVMDAPSAAPKP